MRSRPKYGRIFAFTHHEWGTYATTSRHFCAGCAELSGGAGHRHSAVLSPVLPAAGAAGAFVPMGLVESARPARTARDVHPAHAGGRAGARAHHHPQYLAVAQAMDR